MNFELSNKEREYLGLEQVMPNWEKVVLKGDTYREPSILYFENDTIRKHIISTSNQYVETQYNELTKNREVLAPKTAKGKEKKLTASVLSTKTPIGVYVSLNIMGDLWIGNHTTKTTFYSSYWDDRKKRTENKLSFWIENFIKNSDENHLQEINKFKNAKKQNVKYKSGDFFTYKIDRTNYSFGRILLDINKLRKNNVLEKNHGLNLLMGTPVLVQLYPYISTNKDIDIKILQNLAALPSDFMMDNHFHYGEYEIIGHQMLEEGEFEYPISYGRSINYGSSNVFLQWGLIHRELPLSKFNKYVSGENVFLPENSPSRFRSNPYGYYSCGFSTHYYKVDIVETIKNNNIFDFNRDPYYKTEFDLRNPKNEILKSEIMTEFGLNSKLSYEENCKITGTESTSKILENIK
ncbi:immunity 26/phosphotriesterase HocA family protein [Flavobacterium bizetiae]|uniref:immunity 26/phosphotriesterase HocA family protein n=1 Tax=Flavobacterium bizetiae TaxID=2704140 RepID=UPI0037568C52